MIALLEPSHVRLGFIYICGGDGGRLAKAPQIGIVS
jgi:hypothetical protein